MIDTTIAHVPYVLQDAREGIITMQGLSLKRLLHRIISEYGVYCPVYGCLSVDLHTLDPVDKKLLLSRVLDANEYEDSVSCCQARFDAVFAEHSPFLEKMLSHECDVVWHEMQWEAIYNEH